MCTKILSKATLQTNKFQGKKWIFIISKVLHNLHCFWEPWGQPCEHQDNAAHKDTSNSGCRGMPGGLLPSRFIQRCDLKNINKCCYWIPTPVPESLEDLGITLWMAQQENQVEPLGRFYRKVGASRSMLLNKGKVIIFDILTTTLGSGSYYPIIAF